MLGFAEYRPDLSDVNSDFVALLSNCYPRGDGYGPIAALSSFTSAIAAPCRGYFLARKDDGTVAIFAGTEDRLYKLDNSTFSWTDVSQGGTAYTDLPVSAQWQFAQFNKYVIAVQANANPQVFDLSSSTEFADLGGSPPQAAYVSIVNRFVVLSGLTSYPYRIQWSGLNAPAFWTSGQQSSDYQDFPDGGPARTIGALGGELAIVTQDEAVRRMTFQPGSDVIFTIERVQGGRGIMAPYSLTVAGEKLFYLSPQGFVQSDVSGNPIPIGKEKVDRTFLADLDTSNLQLVIGAADPKSSRVFWAYKSKAGVSGQFDKLLAYDHILQRWAPVTLSGEYLAVLATPGLTLEGLDTINASLDALPSSLDDFATSSLAAFSAITTEHKAALFTGSNLEATLYTSEQSQIATRSRAMGFHVLTDATAAYGCVMHREHPNASASTTTEQAMNSRGFVPCRKDARYMRAKVRIPAGTAWTFATGVEPKASQAGAR